MIVALISNGVVVGFADGFPPAGADGGQLARLDVTGLSPAPQIGWVLGTDGTLSAPPAPTPATPTYPDLSQNAFIGLALAVGALTSAKLVAISKDTSDDVAAFWIRFRAAISISHPDNTTAAGMATRDGLAALVAASPTPYLTQVQSDAIVANWPTA